MGQAKRRGTYIERRNEAMARVKTQQAEIKPFSKAVCISARRTSNLLTVATIAATTLK